MADLGLGDSVEGQLEPYGSFKSLFFLMDNIYGQNLYVGCVESKKDVLA